MNKEKFYQKCSDILNVEYDCEQFKYRKRTRWNNRKPGSGRYPGFGLIRHFGSDIHVTFKDCNKKFKSENEVFTFLRNYIIS